MISGLIRWQTRSEYAHVALLSADGGRIIEAMEGCGVRARLITEEDKAQWQLFDVEGMTEAAWVKTWSFAIYQIGKGYDYLDILRFIIPAPTKANQKRWFCSELVMAALSQGGINALSRIDPAEVSPGTLSNSPLLIASQ